MIATFCQTGNSNQRAKAAPPVIDSNSICPELEFLILKTAAAQGVQD
ncbi:MAG: hypothetical protein QOD75_57 [Blastocatellia bacterium]|nr:hypothetical protein [Blastocatellia bacterium]